MERKIIFILLILVFSCKKKGEEYILSDKTHTESMFKIVMSNDNKRMKIQSLYKGKDKGTLYYIKKEGEFYECDSNYSINSIDKDIFMSTLREYRYRSPHQIFKKDTKIIKKDGMYYITMLATSDTEDTTYYKYYYDSNYKIVKIKLPWGEFVRE